MYLILASRRVQDKLALLLASHLNLTQSPTIACITSTLGVISTLSSLAEII